MQVDPPDCLSSLQWYLGHRELQSDCSLEEKARSSLHHLCPVDGQVFAHRLTGKSQGEMEEWLMCRTPVFPSALKGKRTHIPRILSLCRVLAQCVSLPLPSPHPHAGHSAVRCSLPHTGMWDSFTWGRRKTEGWAGRDGELLKAKEGGEG